MKKKQPTFTGLWMPAGLLSQRNLSGIDKLILSDIAYFQNNSGYQFSWPKMSEKLGCGQSTIRRAVERMSGKMGLIENRSDGYHKHELRLTSKGLLLFDESPPAQEPERPFIKPKATEVEQYAESIGYRIDGQRFIDWYSERGWRVGKTKMKDWQAAVRTWKSRDSKRTGDNGDGAISRISTGNNKEPFIR